MGLKYRQRTDISNDVWRNAYDKLSEEDKSNMDRSLQQLMLIRNLGETGAKELLARLGMHLITGERDLREIAIIIRESKYGDI